MDKEMNVEGSSCNNLDYDNTFASNKKSRDYLKVAAAYVNVAMRDRLDYCDFKECASYSVNEAKARAFAVMTNLAFASEVVLKGKLSDERFNAIPKKDRHNLKILFNSIPKCEQEQIKMIMHNILMLDDKGFSRYMEMCKDGFVEWRYFFEEKKNEQFYDYCGITMFLYTLVYCLITGEGHDVLLEPCEYKMQCYIGESGLYKKKQKIKEEYNNAKQIVLEEGNGLIGLEDEKWLRSIQEKIKDVEVEITRLENKCFTKNK